jgi:hypothetical protein
MKKSSKEIDDVRPISAAERELTRWMLRHGGAPDAERFLAHLELAHVVSRCPCGCASVNFAVSGEAQPAGGMRPLGYGLGGDAPRTLPQPAELRPFHAPS